jgi:hypothetical protein
MLITGCRTNRWSVCWKLFLLFFAFALPVSTNGCRGQNFASTVGDASSSSTLQTAADVDFKARCLAPGVVRCFGFDSPAELAPYLHEAGDGVMRLSVDPAIKASGTGSMRADIPGDDPGGADTSGNFAANFKDDWSFQVGPGEEVYVQWRQRFDAEFLSQQPQPSNGWKQLILSEGSRPGHHDPSSCTEMHLVVENSYYRGLPNIYHSCGRFEDLIQRSPILSAWMLQNATSPTPCLRRAEKFPPCVGYRPNEWMTFQLHVRVGSWYTGGPAKRDSLIQLWIAEEGKPAQLVIDINPQKSYGGVPLPAGWDLRNSDPNAKYGRVWLLPYNTNRTSASTCAGRPCKDAHTWYDELIISRSRIPDPK